VNKYKNKFNKMCLIPFIYDNVPKIALKTVKMPKLAKCVYGIREV